MATLVCLRLVSVVLCLAASAPGGPAHAYTARAALLVGATVVSPCTIATAALRTPLAESGPPKVTCSQDQPYEIRRSRLGSEAAAGATAVDGATVRLFATAPGSPKVQVTEIVF